MAGTNIGSLNATLTLSAFEFQNGLQQSKAAALEFEQATVASAARANKALASVGKGGGFDTGGAARAVQQIGFGIQDFASQFDTRGLAGGIAAVSNNVQMLGAAFGPVGLAISAFGGAIAGIVLPKLIESSGLFKSNKEAVDANASSLAKWRKAMSDAKDVEESYLEGGTEELNRKQTERRAQLAILNKQRSELVKGISRDEEAVEETARQKRLLDNQGGFASFFGAPNVSDNGAGARLQAERAELAKVTEEANKLNTELTVGERLREKVTNVEKARDKTDEFGKNQEYMAKGQEAIDKLRRKGLEEYGSAHSKLIAKQTRERTELEDMTIGLREREEALAQQADMHAVEQQKLKISDREKELSKLGPDAKASAGMDVASVEGIRAINNAISGRGENSMQREQLEIEKRQLVALETIAHGGEWAKSLNFAANGGGDGIALGEATPLDRLSRDGSFSRTLEDGSTVGGANPDATQGKAIRLQRQYKGPDQSAMWDQVNAKKEAEALAGEETRQRIAQIQSGRARQGEAKDRDQSAIRDRVTAKRERDTASGEQTKRQIAEMKKGREAGKVNPIAQDDSSPRPPESIKADMRSAPNADLPREAFRVPIVDQVPRSEEIRVKLDQPVERNDRQAAAGVDGNANSPKPNGVEDDEIKLLRRIADKPTMRVVSLSGG